MARVIDELPDRGKGPGATAKYPWSDWADGQAWLALRGEDYTVREGAFRSALASHARNHGMSVTTRLVHEDGEIVGIAFQFSRNGAVA